MIISGSRTSVIIGFLGAIALLAGYFTIVSSISDTQFAISQFQKFWYYIVTLATGFGVQVGLYTHLRQAIRSTADSTGSINSRQASSPQAGSGKMLVVSGGTSTASMITCCAHYLVNIAPLIATAGIVTFLTQYQVQFFWIGLAFNIGGIAYIANQVRKFSKHI